METNRKLDMINNLLKGFHCVVYSLATLQEIASATSGTFEKLETQVSSCQNLNKLLRKSLIPNWVFQTVSINLCYHHCLPPIHFLHCSHWTKS